LTDVRRSAFLLVLPLIFAVACSPTAAAPATQASAGPTAEGSTSGAAASPSSSGSSSSSASPSPTTTPTPATLELPRGGTKIFPHYRLVGFCGLTGAPALGELGVGDLDTQVKKLTNFAPKYDAYGREVQPVMEIIATIVEPFAGKDGMWRTRISDAQIERYWKASQRYKTLLILNIQPGRSPFIDEAKSYEKWLKKPNVGLALDPEWATRPGQRPGHGYGHTTGAKLNEVASYISDLVQKYNLPEKVMVYHQVAAWVITKESKLKPHPGVALVKSVDGIGNRDEKLTTYKKVNEKTPKYVHRGFKLFFHEDKSMGHGPLMTTKQVMAVKPRPEYVMYE
jgi:hypothetical protein